MEPSINRTLTVSVVSYGVVSVVNGVINVDNQNPIEFPAVLDEASAAKLLKSRYGGKLFPVDANIVVSSIRHEKWKFSMDLSQFVATAARSRVDGTESGADDTPAEDVPATEPAVPAPEGTPVASSIPMPLVSKPEEDFAPVAPEASAPAGGFAPETPVSAPETPVSAPAAPAAPAKEVPYGGNFNFPSDFGGDFGSGFFGG